MYESTIFISAILISFIIKALFLTSLSILQKSFIKSNFNVCQKDSIEKEIQSKLPHLIESISNNLFFIYNSSSFDNFGQLSGKLESTFS
jgi:hypothetical protein